MHSRDGTRAAAAAAAALASAVGPVSYAQSLYGAADGNHIAGRIGVAPFDPLTLPVRSMTEEIAMSAESAVAGSGADTRQGLGRAATSLEDFHERVVGRRRPKCPWTAEVPTCDLLLPPRSSASFTTFPARCVGPTSS